jgi:diguanylate cyclase (GGDEF)-like protein
VAVRILIVDDVPDNIRVLTGMLLPEGYQISAATNGRQALALAQSSTPDLILLDVMMPEPDGHAVCTALKANPRLRHIPVIFVTALGDVEDETRGLALGAVDYITKPFKEAIVKARVRTHLELKRQRDLLEQLTQVDALTGISNRRACDDRLAEEWRRAVRSGGALACLMIDVDHFKAFNDTYGHLAGDDCLRKVASVLDAELRRAGDFLARYGGEEFCGLVAGADSASLAELGERLRAAVAALCIPHASSPTAPWVTVSIGVACTQPTREGLPSDLIAAADRQLFAAKGQGRNRVCLSCT